MNRTQQQQQQRPPNLPQVPTGLQYNRTTGPGYPTPYSMPPRGAMQQQNYPTMASRTTHQMVPTTPGYLQRGAGSASYFGPSATSGMNLPMQPSQNASLSSMQQSSAQQSLALHQQQQQQQQNAAMHLAASQATGTSSNSSDNVIDQSDFPPLGSNSAPQNNATGGTSSSQTSANFHSTYASQAGTTANGGQPPSAVSSAAPGPSQRDFGHDEFPPLGAPPTNQGSHSLQGLGTGQDGLSNGFGSQQQPNSGIGLDQAQRSMMFGAPQGSSVQVQRGGQTISSEMDKRQQQQTFAKLNNQISHLPWSGQQQTAGQGFPSTIPNGHQHLAAPPNLPAPSGFNGQSFASGQPPQPSSHLQMPQQSLQHQSSNTSLSAAAAGAQPSDPSSLLPMNPVGLPQTPAQQILLSAADRWGLLGLLANIKGTDSDSQLLASGTDLAQIGLDLATAGQLSSMFITPWADASAAQSIEPEFHLPACYSVNPPAPGPQKVASFTDETLFFMFYSLPRDTLQEVAAQELYNRNWRYHKDAGVWLTKDTGHSPLQKDATSERGTYTFFDPTRWEKIKKEAVIFYDQLEERALPPSLSAMNMNMGMNVAAGVGGMGMATQQGQQLSMRG